MVARVRRFVHALGKVAGDFVRHPFTDSAAGVVPAPGVRPPSPAVGVRPTHPPGYGALKHPIGTPLFDQKATAGKAGANAAAPDFAVDETPLRSVSTFKTILWFLIVISAGCLIGHVALSFLWPAEMTDAQKYSLGLLDWGFKGGFGTILGMFGGKAAASA